MKSRDMNICFIWPQRNERYASTLDCRIQLMWALFTAFYQPLSNCGAIHCNWMQTLNSIVYLRKFKVIYNVFPLTQILFPISQKQCSTADYSLPYVLICGKSAETSFILEHAYRHSVGNYARNRPLGGSAALDQRTCLVSPPHHWSTQTKYKFRALLCNESTDFEQSPSQLLKHTVLWRSSGRLRLQLSLLLHCKTPLFPICTKYYRLLSKVFSFHS